MLCRTLLPLAAAGFLGVCVNAYGGEPSLSEKELDEWFYDDEGSQPDEIRINYGELRFLTEPPEKRAPYSQNLLTINAQSLLDGWVKIEQCHAGLDPMHMVEIVYGYKQMRGLIITKVRGIGQAWVEGQSVQLKEVTLTAELCVQLEARILHKRDSGGWVLRNGPYQRRFLDSYFPLHLTLRINFPEELLQYIGSQPKETEGLGVVAETDSVVFDAWFEGQLVLEIYFSETI